MAEPTPQTFTDETVPPKEPDAALTLEERVEKVLGYKPKTLESRRKIQEKVAREQSRATGTANMPVVQESLKSLVTIYGEGLGIKTPQQMETYLRNEAIKEGPLPRILNTRDASNFFSNVARAEFAYEPRADTPIYSLDAYREGFKRSKKEQQDAAKLMEQAYQGEARPDVNYVTSYGGQKLEAPRFNQENEVQKDVFDKLNTELSGGALGNLFGLTLTPEQIELQQRASGVSPADLKAMGQSDYEDTLNQVRDTVIASDVTFAKQRYRPTNVFVHLMDVSGKGKNAINLHNYRRDFAIAFSDIAAHEAGFPSFAKWAASDELTPTQAEEVLASADEKALREIKQIQQQSRPGTVFIDDPDKLVRAVSKGEDPLAYTSIPVNVAAGLKNLGVISEGTYDAFLRQRGPWAAIWYPPSMRQFNMGTLTYAEQVEDINPGTFQQIMNIGPLRVLGSWILADDPNMVYGSQDHLREMLQFDWGQNLGKVGEKTAELTGLKDTDFEKLVTAMGTIGGAAAMFVEPDAITLATLPVGYIGKGAKVGSKALAKTVTGAETVADAAVVYRLRRYDKLLAEAQEKIADGTFKESTQVFEFFKKNKAQELSDMYDVHLMGELGTSIRAGTTGRREYSPRFDALTSKLDETRQKIRDIDQTLSEEVSAYVNAYGKVPPDADASAIALLRKKQEEAVLETGQAYAAFVSERVRLAQMAEQRGVQLSTLKQRDTKGSFFAEDLIPVVEESREAFLKLTELNARLFNRQKHYEALQSFTKLTKNQKKDLSRLEKEIPKLKRERREAQELTRKRWADAQLEGQYQKYANAKRAFEEKTVQTSRLFDDLPLQKDAVTGAKFNPAQRVREAWRDWSDLDLKLSRLKKRAEKQNISKAERKRYLKAIADESPRLKALHNELLQSVDIYTKAAAKGTPGIADIGRNLYQKLDQETLLGITENKSAYMQNAVGAIKKSVDSYTNAIQTNRLKTSAPIVQDKRFVKRLDPDDDTKVIFDRDKYVDELVRKFTDDVDPALHNEIRDSIHNSAPIRELFDVQLNPKGHVTLDGIQLRKLADFENSFSAQRLAETENLVSVAQGLIRSWSRPPMVDKVFRNIDIKDPRTWVDTALRAGYRGAQHYRRLLDPQAHRFGDFHENVLASAQVAVTRQERANEELTLLADQWIRKGDNYRDNTLRYLTTNEAFFIHFRGQKAVTDEGLGVGVPAIMNQGEFTPWQQFKSYILGLQDPAESLALKAVAYAYVPRRANLEQSKFSEFILGNALKWLKEIDDQADLLSDAEQLTAFVEKIKKYTEDQIGVDLDANRTFAFVAKGILHGSVANDFLVNLVRSGGMAATTKQALAANTILGEVKSVVKHDPTLQKDVVQVASTAPGARSGFNPSDAFRVLEQYGLSMDDAKFTTVYRQIKRMEDLSTTLIATNRLADSSKVSFVPQSLITQIEEVAGKISKDLGAMKAPDNIVKKALNLLGAYLRQWRTNILFGTITPRSTYFSNQYFGDLSQLHTFEGTLSIRKAQLGKHKGKVYATGAAPLMFQNAFTYVPYWGGWIQDFLVERTKDATRAGRRNVLTTPLQAVMNPYITDLMRMSDELFETKEGFRTGKQFMEEALEDGVLDTLMTDDLYALLNDVTKASRGTWVDKVDQTLTGVNNFSQNWRNMVTTTQARQRLALYADYRLMRGEARTASKQAVLDSLYDWRHGVTDWEMATIGQIVAFYPFFRLGMKQFQRAMLEGMTAPSLDLAKRAMVGQSKAARIRNQGRLVYSVANYVWNEDVDQALNEAEMQHEIYRRLRPWWTGSRPAPSNSLMSEADQVEFRRAGRTETYFTTTFPMWTSLDMADLHLRLFNGITGAMLYYGNSGQVRPTYDAGKVVTKTISDFAHPIFKQVVGGTVEFLADEPAAYRSPKGTRLRLGENGAYLAYSKVPFLGSLINITPDKKGYYVNNTTAALIRGIPVIGTDIPNLWRDLGPVSMGGGNPKWAKNSTEAMGFFLRNTTGIGKQIAFAPEQDIDYTRKQRVSDMKKRLKQVQEQAASGGDPEIANNPAIMLFDEDK